MATNPLPQAMLQERNASMNHDHQPRRLLRSVLAVALVAAGSVSMQRAVADELPAPAASPAVATYDRLLPLEGGSNFRDMGGYFTADGQRVRRGLLYRSGVMTSLTQADQAWLRDFGFQRVLDLRSTEERDLYPNRWAIEQDIELLAHEYSMSVIIEKMVDENGEVRGMQDLYRAFPEQLKPQLTLFFDELVEGNVPLVVNCSAGQDRTGLTSALLLLALGVPQEVVMQDYLLSTRFRRPAVERGDVDLAAAAEDNWFAQLMLRYSEGRDADHAAEPLLTDEGVPYLRFALDTIEQDYGSVQRFLATELGVDAAELATLRERYLVAASAPY